MKIIEHSYGADLKWVSKLANLFGGKVEGNFIKVPEESQKGTRYVLDCGNGIIAYFLNIEYKKSFRLVQKNTGSDFVGFYYNLTEGEASLSGDNFNFEVGKWQFNLTVLDGTLESSYNIKARSKSFVLCIFIKKKTLKHYFSKLKSSNSETIFNSSKNTIVRFDRMSDESYHLINDLRKLTPGGAIFDLNLAGTVHILLGNFLKKMTSQRIIIQKVNKADLAAIISCQKYLLENIVNPFPSIKIMANIANMSESKFKTLFKKITGKTPSNFFMDNKLVLAKNLLEKKQLTIMQVSQRLNFISNSYFSARFKQRFGMSPKRYLQHCN